MILSIIIPVYNGEKYITRCLDSIFKCEDLDFEVVVIDDGSTDSTEVLCEKYKNRERRLRVLRQDNAGVAAARNIGLDTIDSDYVMFVDSDDCLCQEWGHNIQQALNERYDVCFFDYCRVFPSGNKEYVKIFAHNGEVNKDSVVEKYLYSDILNAPWAKLYKCEILKLNKIVFPQGMKIGEDAVFVGKVIEHSKDFLYVQKNLVDYYDIATSASYKTISDLEDKEKLFDFKRKISNIYKFNEYRLIHKFLNDYMSTLRFCASSTTRKVFCNLCSDFSKYNFVNCMINYEGLFLDFRRKIQIRLFKRKCYGIMYYIMKVEMIIILIRDYIRGKR